jgi:hypothetical protein
MARRNGLAFLFIAAALAVVFLWPRDDAGPPGDRPTTIVLITPDTLRWDHVGAYVPGMRPPSLTPHTDALAGRGTRFEDARAPVPLTLPGHVTMLAGLPPAATGVRLNSYGRLLPPERRGFPMLQERLREHGWHTAAFVSAAVLGTRYGLDQGFDHYDDGELLHHSTVTVQERAGAETVDAALAHVRALSADAPLFLWVHLFEPHAPYAADGTYAGDVRTCDEAVGRLLDGLEAAGRGDAAVMLASDHGEALGELDERTHGLLLADGVLRVPFLLAVPGTDPGTRDDPVTLADVAPTLAAVAGVPWEPVAGPGCGLDLWTGPAPEDRVRIAESLYAHHRFRWAQLVGAIGPGGTLVDAGLDRLHWVPPSRADRPLAATGVAPEDDETKRLAQAIVAYRGFERPERIRQGQTAGYYYGAGRVEGFLPPAENRRLPDPYGSVLRARRLDGIKAVLMSRQAGRETVLRAQIDALEALNAPNLDAGSPELHFYRGMAYEKLAAVTGSRRDAAQAERAYVRAFELGRKDTQTLVRACGVNAGGREAAMLDQLETLGKQLDVRGCQYWLLKTRLLRAIPGRAAEAKATCNEAAVGPCDNPRDRPLWKKLCGETGR